MCTFFQQYSQIPNSNFSNHSFLYWKCENMPHGFVSFNLVPFAKMYESTSSDNEYANVGIVAGNVDTRATILPC